MSCCLLLICLLLPPAPVQAQAPLWDTIIIAVAPNTPPFADETNDGGLVGFDIDILKNLMRLSGLQSRYEKTNFAYIIPGVATELYDTAIGCLFMNDTRQKMVSFTTPYFTTGLVLVVRSNNDAIHTPKDLTPLTRVSVRIGSEAEFFARQQTKARVQASASVPGVLQQVVDRAADAAIVNEMSAKAFIKARPDIQIHIVGFLTLEQCAFPVNKNDTALLAQLNQALVRLKNSRQYDSIYHKWFGDRPTMFEPMRSVTPTLTAPANALATPMATSTVSLTASMTPTQQWAGVYYLTAKTPMLDAPTVYQIVTLTPDGIWSGTEIRQNGELITNTQMMSSTNGTANQQGAWQADATGNITATVLAFPPATASQLPRGLQRLQYQLKIDANGMVSGQYVLTPYQLGDNPLVASLTTTQTQTLSVTGQRVKP
ncbi:MAG: transporter substrate-binding domain-containing protein [Caldilineaceae bacterium]